ncbi:MAG: glycoside hydrolase family 97 protein, partial [Alistipes sp.]|nr:glycoside hydrolase family 97 protein [Alistipes sp.]
LTYDIVRDGRTLLEPSPIALTLSDGRELGPSARVLKASRTSVDTTVPSPLYRSAEVRDRYNSLTLRMKGGWSVEFRAYADGIAYRFATTARQPFEITGEQVVFRFPGDFTATVPYVAVGSDGDFESQFRNSFENTYTTAPLSALNRQRLAFLPLAVDAGDGVKICITETDLRDYPGLYLINRTGGSSLEGVFAPYPKRVVQGGYNNLQMVVEEREPFIARVDGPRTFPWRVAIIGDDTAIASSDLSWLLAEPSHIDDTSWIRPGKVAWDWWNAWNIAGVGFRAGVNTETYKYYIDFAADNGIEYVILDEGWAVNLQADLMQVVPGIDLPGIVEYGRQKGVGIILWAGYWAFDRDLERVCKHYSEMGVKGFKVDFMDRDDQPMTDFNHRAAATAAKYGLVLDLHGSHKPAGLNRTWPNVLNFEGVHGLEQMKWSAPHVDQMRYDVTIPFIRQAAGPMDYTQGAMLNATRENYRPCDSEPMSQGTRCHQLALYVVLDSPLNMLCDSPTNYLKEPECTKFIAGIPTVWDRTLILDGRMGEYIVTARRSGDTGYVGGITDWTPRDITVDLAKLGIDGTVDATIFRDGVNADRKASDYVRENVRIDTTAPLEIHLAPGGGFTIELEAQR